MDRSPLCTSLAGIGGGLMSTLVCSPLDVAKTRLQLHFSAALVAPTNSSLARSPATPSLVSPSRGPASSLATSATAHTPRLTLRSVLSAMWCEEGVRGLYRGLGPSLVSVPLYWGLYFPVYNLIHIHLESRRAARGRTSAAGALADNLLAAVCAGAFSNTATNPFWIIRTRMIAPGSSSYQGLSTSRALARLYSSEGVRGLYRGLAASYLGLSHIAIQFPIYEELKRQWRSLSGADTVSFQGLIAASALSKIVASAATYPHEVVRARIFSHAGPDRMGVWATFTTILRTSGVRALYSGMGTNMLRTVPACVVNFLTYEAIRAQIVKLFDRPHPVTYSVDKRSLSSA